MNRTLIIDKIQIKLYQKVKENFIFTVHLRNIVEAFFQILIIII